MVACVGHILNIFWAYLGQKLGICQEYLGHILDILRLHCSDIGSINRTISDIEWSPLFGIFQKLLRPSCKYIKTKTHQYYI